MRPRELSVRPRSAHRFQSPVTMSRLPLARLQQILLSCLLVLNGVVALATDDLLHLTGRVRTEVTPGAGLWHTTSQSLKWKPAETCIVVCDMWDDHWCKPSAARVAELAPHMNQVLCLARQRGVLILHCPSDTMDFYRDTPQRKRAQAAPVFPTEKPLERWIRLIPEREGNALPIDDSDGGCDCDPPVSSHRAWTRQHPAIEIHEEDAITDSAEAFYLMKQRGVRNVIVMGVHTNMCVLGRPFSIRQMVLQGQNVVLMRDMTDSMYNPPRSPQASHFGGTDLVVRHIEQFWCPTVLSSDITGKAPFRFAEDRRPHVVIVTSEPEYRTEVSLTSFERELWKDFRVSMVYGDSMDGSLLPGLDVLKSADLLLLSTRRRTLPPDQLKLVREFIASGKPVVGIRTASHPFHLRNQNPPEGRVDWPEFDNVVNGGHYTNHHGAGPTTTLSVASDTAARHPILQDVDVNSLKGMGSLYQVSPLADSTVPLLIGQIPEKSPEPVAWLNRRSDGGLTFYTSLGHTGDFEQPEFRRLLLNACHFLTTVPTP